MKKILKRLLKDIESRVIFYPMRKYIDPIEPDLEDKVQKLHYQSNCGINLDAWYIESNNNKPVILYCHGQAEHIAFYQKPYQVLSQNGYGVFAPEYRCHGQCSVKNIMPTEQGIYDDIDSSIAYMKNKLGINEKNIIVWGRSMGGAIAAEAATKYDFKGVILESTFTTIREVSDYIATNGCNHTIFPWYRKWLFRLSKVLPAIQTFDTSSKIHRIKAPLLIAHSIPDIIVDYRMALENAKRHGNAKLFISEEGCHDNSDWFYDEALNFLESLTPATINQAVSS